MHAAQCEIRFSLEALLDASLSNTMGEKLCEYTRHLWCEVLDSVILCVEPLWIAEVRRLLFALTDFLASLRRLVLELKQDTSLAEATAANKRGAPKVAHSHICSQFGGEPIRRLDTGVSDQLVVRLDEARTQSTVTSETADHDKREFIPHPYIGRVA